MNCRDFYFQGLGLYSSILSFQPFFLASLRVFILSLPQPFFFLCFRDLPVNQFNPNFLPSISIEIARNEFQLPLYCSYFGITEFSRSNTGFSTLKKYLIDPVISWFVKSCNGCLSFSCCQSCRVLPQELALNL